MKIRNAALIGAILVAGTACPLLAQNISSSILGIVVDPGGSVVPGAEIKLTNRGTAAVNTTLSDSGGFFRIPNIFAGTYTVTVQAKGFKLLTVDNIVLGTSEARDLGQVALSLGNVTETINVTGELAAVQTASSERSAVVESKELNTLAIKGRDMTAVAELARHWNKDWQYTANSPFPSLAMVPSRARSL